MDKMNGTYPQTYVHYWPQRLSRNRFPAAAFIVQVILMLSWTMMQQCGRYVGKLPYIGRKITHGFDDQGKFNTTKGILHNWWAQKILLSLQEAGSRIINQFNQYEPTGHSYQRKKKYAG